MLPVLRAGVSRGARRSWHYRWVPSERDSAAERHFQYIIVTANSVADRAECGKAGRVSGVP